MPSAFTLREILSQFSRQKDVISLTQVFHDIGAKLASTANSCLEEEFKRKEIDRVFGQRTSFPFFNCFKSCSEL